MSLIPIQREIWNKEDIKKRRFTDTPKYNDCVFNYILQNISDIQNKLPSKSIGKNNNPASEHITENQIDLIACKGPSVVLQQWQSLNAEQVQQSQANADLAQEQMQQWQGSNAIDIIMLEADVDNNYVSLIPIEDETLKDLKNHPGIDNTSTTPAHLCKEDLFTQSTKQKFLTFISAIPQQKPSDSEDNTIIPTLHTQEMVANEQQNNSVKQSTMFPMEHENNTTINTKNSNTSKIDREAHNKKINAPPIVVRSITDSVRWSNPINPVHLKLLQGDKKQEYNETQWYTVNENQEPAAMDFSNLIPENEPIVEHQLISQLADRIKVLLKNQHSEMEVHVKPEKLGKIVVKVIMENGILSARITAESRYVKEFIQSHVHELQNQLREEGYNFSHLDVNIADTHDQPPWGDTHNNAWFRNSPSKPQKTTGTLVEQELVLNPTTYKNEYSHRFDCFA
jgi:flagellar hook-length control protein FliK